ncbi:MAG: hypothetical protein FD130_303 [Halothiobacillaceae bacterium]|nr:MAG: hypothetical protein FD130_303 [Halothiobacillaceae bacterium]
MSYRNRGLGLLLGMVMWHGAALAGDKACNVQHFIGTGKTMDLSFSACEEAVATQTFKEEFILVCQHGIVTYQLKQRPDAKYMQLGSDGHPARCTRS